MNQDNIAKFGDKLLFIFYKALSPGSPSSFDISSLLALFAVNYGSKTRGKIDR